MLDILQGTPLWMYAIYLWICYYGIKACLGERENRRSLMILPVVLVVWSRVRWRAACWGCCCSTPTAPGSMPMAKHGCCLDLTCVAAENARRFFVPAY
ncbi:hypothetical protein [Pseudomonas sp. FP2338]|uniref:hypothetical protein n=1 Tax=Pseudomonas sp. FP2338 TaxID=2954093 RepID=UPI0027362F0C|nr:hypothetical protein [Pseudomonas sp. FP2338]WLH83827.1 hypothetical protein PSH96_23910 [Pseudomonas sp. FP2338]